ncbi:MAG: MOSC domain-containing protein [Actinomycetota bacterium]|nr:MOSC domain-containing protein [Actinomycetota bacterium]
MSDAVGTVKAVWRFPVKSMLGERLDAAELTEGGLVGDRAYALVDVESGKVVSAKQPRLWPDLFGCRARFVEPPVQGASTPPVRITFPDGNSVTSDSLDVDDTLSGFFGRKVTLASAAPADFTIDQYHPDIEELDPAGHRDTTTETKLGSALFDEIGAPSPVPAGSFFDVFPVSVLTTSTIDRLTELRPESRFDERRFRMNVIVKTNEGGFVENGWLGREVEVGNGVRIKLTMPDPRCVMPTLAQEDLPRDNEVLRTLVRHNKLEIPGAGLYPCAGVYGVIEAAGTIREGDAVSIS